MHPRLMGRAEIKRHSVGLAVLERSLHALP
jgi:hypothetical protein